MGAQYFGNAVAIMSSYSQQHCLPLVRWTLLSLQVFILIACPVNRAFAWGQEGHSIIAELAERRLDVETLRKVKILLGGVSMPSVASWADDYRATHPDSASWHFVDIPFDQNAYDPTRDCKPEKGDCIIHAIARFRADVTDCSKSLGERGDALKFLIHFVGDIHQPLHVETRFNADGTDDQGGNKVLVTFFDQPNVKLHALWDTGLIMHTVYNWGAYVTRLQTGWLNGRDTSSLDGGTPTDWALEAHRYVPMVYDIPADNVLGRAYYDKALPIVDRQLAIAALRLVRLLKETLRNADACP
ncbi:S1/P1 nuclease [Bradyrhizobium ontarionense]|uniref:S1/P1 nuclease n=1 Tax=Bradyrhizobium ontarionense TaxID=2898149 RepID=A0ABY3RKS7_9BRAD|nr:S1/P1 nuclease [Bradyrhizobium sp. A19]UFZ08071.1 S1/P1 nuclease [Bradyrhizobium sp. A19]